MPSGRAVIVVERERARHGPSSPAAAGELVLEPLGDEQERRRARPAVQIFVAAADREVAAVPSRSSCDRAGAVRQVPHRQRAGGVRRGVDRGHVVDRAAAIIDVGQHHDGGVVVDRADDLVGARTAFSSSPSIPARPWAM